MKTQKDIPDVESISNINAMDKSTLQNVFKGVKSALVVTPHSKSGYSNDAEMTCNMLDEACKQGVKHVVLLSSWTVKEPAVLSQLSSRFLKSEEKLKQLETEHDLKWTVLRGGYFLKNYLQTWAPMIKKGRNVTSTQMKLAPVSTDDIGRCAAVCLNEGPNEHHGKVYEMSGPELLSIEEIGEQIAQATGTQFKVNIIPSTNIKSPPYLKELTAYLEKTGESAVPYTDDIDALIGKNTSVFEWALENVRDFK